MLLILLVFAEVSFAGDPVKDGDSALIGPICNVLVKIQGPWGSSLLLFGAIFLGFNVLIGKVSIGMVLMYLAATTLILAGEKVGNVISGGNFSCKSYVSNLTGP
jgi:type IV secretory pathway VirB2 component (pilin)